MDKRFDRATANAQRGSKTVHEGLEWHALADVRSDAWRRLMRRLHIPKRPNFKSGISYVWDVWLIFLDGLAQELES